MNTTHLNALELHLSNERERLRLEPSKLREVWVAQLEREITAEKAFLGITETTMPEMTDEELLAALTS